MSEYKQTGTLSTGVTDKEFTCKIPRNDQCSSGNSLSNQSDCGSSGNGNAGQPSPNYENTVYSVNKRFAKIERDIQILNDGLGKLFAIEDKKNKKARKKLKELSLILYNECRISCESTVSLRSMINKLESRVDKLDGNVSPVVELGKPENKTDITLADYNRLKTLNDTYEEDILNTDNRNKELIEQNAKLFKQVKDLCDFIQTHNVQYRHDRAMIERMDEIISG